jgi:hypothetical protein
MSNNQKKAPGAHYSGTNPVPNIQRFVESLDADKKDRDAKIAESTRAKQTESGVTEHKSSRPAGISGTRKKVTDPTTGREVEIEDVNADFMKAADKPYVMPYLYYFWTCADRLTDICAKCESRTGDDCED